MTRNNIDRTRSFLEEALRTLPGDFALGQARAHIAAALESIARIEEKRQRRIHNNATPPMWNYLVPKYNMTAAECRQAIAGLDRMIQDTNDLKPRNDESENDIQDIQTIFD